MPEVRINNATLAFFGSVIAIVVALFQGYTWLNETVATKSDISRLESLVKINRLETNLNRNEWQLRQLEKIDILSPLQQREYNELVASNKRLNSKKIELMQ